MNRLTYVMSGCSYTRLIFPEVFSDTEFRNELKLLFDIFNNDFALLFNAFTERGFGEPLNLFRDKLSFIEADSGGLQIITQGKTVTPEIKQQIYATQAQFSDYAMSFDEIPVLMSGKTSGRNDVTNRVFDQRGFEEKARQSGRNLKEQIDVFNKLNSSAQPIAIIHGNSYETYMEWAELMLEELGDSAYYDQIGGIAMAGAALGTGSLEDIQRVFFFSQLPKEIKKKNHLHLLGIGSIVRMLPSVVFLRNGVLEDVHLSYDSTTHSQGAHFGWYYYKNYRLDFPKLFDHIIHEKILTDLKEKFKIDTSMAEFEEILRLSSLDYQDVRGHRKDFIKVYLAMALGSAFNFMRHLYECIDNKDTMLKAAGKEFGIFNALQTVKTLDEFNSWNREIGRYVKSSKVKSTQQNHLGELFQ